MKTLVEIREAARLLAERIGMKQKEIELRKPVKVLRKELRDMRAEYEQLRKDAARVVLAPESEGGDCPAE